MKPTPGEVAKKRKQRGIVYAFMRVSAGVPKPATIMAPPVPPRVSKQLISLTFRQNLQKLILANETSVGLPPDESEMPRSYSRGVILMSGDDDTDAQHTGLEMDAFATGNDLDGVGEPGVFSAVEDRTFQFR